MVNYSKKILKVYFPLTITGSFYDKIISYSMWRFIYGSAVNEKMCIINLRLKNFTCVCDFLYRNVSKTYDQQKLDFLNWNLEIWVFFSRVMVNILIIHRTNKHSNRKKKKVVLNSKGILFSSMQEETTKRTSHNKYALGIQKEINYMKYLEICLVFLQK